MTERSEDALKACPFECGHPLKPVVSGHPIDPSIGLWLYLYTVRCPCGAQGPEKDNEAEAIAAWNTRSEASAPVIDEGLIKRLFGEFGVFRMARTGWLGSNDTAKVQEVIETETQLRAALNASHPENK